MFKIIDFHRNTSGKIVITIETDDSTSALMFRLFSQADKFAQLLYYRIQTESRLDASQKSKSPQLAQMRKHRARMLEKFRGIQGSRSQQLKILQEMCIAEGEHIKQDRISAQLQIALEEEKEVYRLRVKRLIKQGKSLKDIASSLNLPKSTVARYAKSKKTTKPKGWRVYPPPASETAG